MECILGCLVEANLCDGVDPVIIVGHDGSPLEVLLDLGLALHVPHLIE